MNSKAQSTNLRPSSHPNPPCFQLTAHCSEMLSRLRFDFVSEAESDGIIVLAARHKAAARRTIALVGWPALDDLRRVICRCYQTLGCDLVIIICLEMHSMARLTRRLRRILPIQLRQRVGVITHSAWQMLLANVSAKPTPSPSENTWAAACAT
jgi:hypothetical protein